MAQSGLSWVPHNFLALAEEQSDLLTARAVLVPVPYDSTTSFRSGARDGPGAIIEASSSIEDYDHELAVDVSQIGIHTTPAIQAHMGGPAHMVDRVRAAVEHYVRLGKIVGLLGGEHSITVGSVQAQREAHPDLSVLYLDAHADLRHEYMDTQWGHASGARRIHEICPLVLVGIRSLCLEERDYIRAQAIPTFFWPLTGSPPPNLPPEGAGTGEKFYQDVIGYLAPSVYISVDLDVFDPSLMAAVGTPEPGGMGWYEVIGLLRAVGEARRIVGFDISELCPREGPSACAYIAAKLAYKLVAYAAVSQGT